MKKIKLFGSLDYNHIFNVIIILLDNKIDKFNYNSIGLILIKFLPEFNFIEEAEILKY